MPKPRVIYWFRTDLRLHDSPALNVALNLHPDCLYPVWTWDPHYVYRARVGSNRWQYLLECQADLSKSITELNPQSKLLLIREAPQTVFPKLFKAWKITHLVFEKDTDAYARERDGEVVKLAEEAGVKVLIKCGRTLYDPDLLVQANNGKPTMSISQVQAAAKKLGPVPRPIPAPTSLPSPGDTSLPFSQSKPAPSPDLNSNHRSTTDESYANLAGPNNDFAIPTLHELGINEATTPHHGGETLALQQLDKILTNKTYTATFEKPKTAPTDFEPQATTLLSPHLHFGSLSVRQFYWGVQDTIAVYHGTPSTPPTSLIGQLLFRDMYFGAQASLGHAFSHTHNNPQCRFIPWHLPSTISPATNRPTDTYTIDSPQAEEWFSRWRDGRTGFPFVDALMRQLRTEGWIHHLGRHLLACFLTRGGCYISWERGAAVFEEFLLDHEVACNAGNWQWLSCTAFYSQYYRCYSPVAFGRKWDREGRFVKRYVPELEAYGEKFIYEPWKAPRADQRKWKCLVGGDGMSIEENGVKVYPKPMFDFGERRDVCLKGMKKAYEVGLYGDDERVLDGRWRELFGEDDVGDTGGESGQVGNDDVEADEDGQGHEPSARKGKKDPASGKGKGKGKDGHKREASQSTLDGMFTRNKKKK